MWSDTPHMDALETDGEFSVLRSKALDCSDHLLDIRVPSK